MAQPVSSNAPAAVFEAFEEALEGEVTIGVPPTDTSLFALAAEAIVPSFFKVTVDRVMKGPTYPTWNYPFEVAIGAIRSVLYHQKAHQKELFQGVKPSERRAICLEKMGKARKRIDGGLEKNRYSKEGIHFEPVILERSGFPSVFKTNTEIDSLVDETGSLDMEWVSHKNSSENRVVLYFHGGAYCAMSPKTHRGITTVIARTAKCGVLAVNYRLAPEFPFPSALHDALISYIYLVKNLKVSPDRIILAGDSAGGGLTAALLHYIRDYGSTLDLPQPAAAAMLSPWLDLSSTSGSSWTDKTLPDYIPYFENTPPKEWWDPSRLYMDKVSLKHPLGSPLWGSWEGLPPILAHYGGLERLKSDGEMVVQLLQEQAREKNWTVEFFPGGCHVFHGFMTVSHEGRLGMEHIRRYMEEIWDKSVEKKIYGQGVRTVRVR
ncbi:hypothetical protein PROFUN_03519 [Planoprotostelium fungivorum]|uniref:Alpha/beta hydrolase fold-3 domain-containing protein n=1 Tax=Planoprotostelium fungivorum TaxID=1890364 RepID=A0A2P6MNE7_9EUKA|nr:hypothetical protein PROFUN_03519 [Planoprotostelium fungivorum]